MVAILLRERYKVVAKGDNVAENTILKSQMGEISSVDGGPWGACPPTYTIRTPFAAGVRFIEVWKVSKDRRFM